MMVTWRSPPTKADVRKCRGSTRTEPASSRVVVFVRQLEDRAQFSCSGWAWLEAGEHVRILARLPPHITSHQQLEGGGWVSIPYQSIMSHIASNQHGCQASGAR